MLKIAIQNNGRLTSGSISFLKFLGLEFDLTGRMLMSQCKNMDVSILYMRNSDIPEYVESGVVDFGIVGENVLMEKVPNVKILERLSFGECDLVLAVPEASDCESAYDLRGKTIATSYPNTLSRYLKENNIYSRVVFLNGSVEIAPALGVADAICDLTQTGTTLKENNLKIIDRICSSRAVFVESPFYVKEKAKIINLINYGCVKC